MCSISLTSREWLDHLERIKGKLDVRGQIAVQMKPFARFSTVCFVNGTVFLTTKESNTVGYQKQILYWLRQWQRDCILFTMHNSDMFERQCRTNNLSVFDWRDLV